MLFACSWIADCSAATHEIKLCVSTMSGMSEGACFPFNVSRSIRTSPSRAIGAAWHAPYRMAPKRTEAESAPVAPAKSVFDADVATSEDGASCDSAARAASANEKELHSALP